MAIYPLFLLKYYQICKDLSEWHLKILWRTLKKIYHLTILRNNYPTWKFIFWFEVIFTFYNTQIRCMDPLFTLTASGDTNLDQLEIVECFAILPVVVYCSFVFVSSFFGGDEDRWETVFGLKYFSRGWHFP